MMTEVGNILCAEERVMDNVFTGSPFCGQLVVVMLGGVRRGREGGEGRATAGREGGGCPVRPADSVTAQPPSWLQTEIRPSRGPVLFINIDWSGVM